LIPLFIIWDKDREKSSPKILVVTLLIYILGLSLSLAPFTIKRHSVKRAHSVAATSQIAMNLYLGNNLNNHDPYYRPVPFASSSPLEQTRDFNIEAGRRLGKRLPTGESSRYWINEVYRMALDQPGAFIRKLFQKMLVLFNQFEAGDHYHIGFMSQFAGFFKTPLFSFWIILPFGMAGMAVTIGRSRKLLFISSTVFLYGLTLIIFFTNTRYRLPMMVVLIPFAAMGAKNFISYLKSKDNKSIAIYAAIVAVFFIIEFLPLKGTGDLTAYYNTHAIILNSKGLEDEAMEYWEESSRMDKPYSAFANLYLASKYLGRNDLLKAKEYLDKVPEDSFAASSKYQLLGDIMRSEGKLEEAVKAYERSIEINSGNLISRQRMIKVLWRTDRERAMREFDLLEAMGTR
jgi:tetratricopeptide (TPR) repeat protein